ncbi:MAG: membrane protein insertase YidC [Bryobacteraceae bacterium]
MADTTNGQPPPNPGQKKKELPMELRLLLALVLTGLVLFVTPYFYKGAQSPLKKNAPAAGSAKTPAVNDAAAPAAAQPTAEAPAAPGSVPPISGQKEETRVVDTDLFHITFTNKGAVVRNWQLKKFTAHAGAPLELVNTTAHTDLPFALYFPEQKPSTDLNQALWDVKTTADGLGVTFDFSDGNTVAHKEFHFQKKSYLSSISADVTAGGKPIPSLLEWRGGFGDLAVPNPSGVMQTLRYDLADGKLVKTAAKAAKDGPVVVKESVSFVGIEDQYFVAAFLPDLGGTVQMATFSDSARTPLEAKEAPFAGVGAGSGPPAHFALYVGPKDIDTLRAVNPKLEQVVDFGWFGFLAKPLFLVVNWVTDHAIHNYGWSIIVVTIALNFALFPLKLTSMKSMKKMQALQPQIAAINEKYKNIGMRDPKKAEQNQEVMDLYKKHGVNPMGGCVPMLLQIPFFIAFYKVFSVSVEMRGAHWLWVTDLSQPETLPIHILPIVMIVSQFLMQKMTPTTPGGDPNQQRMMMFMPLIFGFMFYNFSSGLVLYYLTSNLVGIAQQWFFNRTSIAAVAAQSVQPPPKKKIGRK